MTYDQKTIRTRYKKLLTLYPQAFREQFGESMEQTFNDLCNERKRRTERRLFGFVLWLFVETVIGIVKEHVLLITQGDAMKSIITNLGSAGIISFVLVLPFAILELVNRRHLPEGFPVALFGFLWLLPTAFIVILVPIVRTVRAGNDIIATPLKLLLKVAFLTLIATMWVGLFIDQLPCFLGVPNCD